MLTLLAALLSPAAVRAADPAYEQLLADGLRAYQKADHATARRLLQLANFGLLDEPPQLAVGLVHLALAEAATKDVDSLRATLRRVLEIEERFSAYGESSLDTATRDRFEALLAQHVEESALRDLPVFDGVRHQRNRARVEALAPKERRPALVELVAQEPTQTRWRLMLADLELRDGQPARAAELLAPVLESDPDNDDARCLTGQARATAGDCAGAVELLGTCPWTLQEAALAQLQGTCLLDLQRWQDAEELLAQLPEPLRSSRPINRLNRRLGRERPAPLSEPAVVVPEEQTAQGQPPADAAPVLPTDAEAQLEEIRLEMRSARRAPELDAPLTRARELALSYPEFPEVQHLAAEIAYRASRWQEAVDFFRRGGDPGVERPILLFFYAVSQFEAGEPDAAASTLERCLPYLQKSSFVEEYQRRILGTDGES